MDGRGGETTLRAGLAAAMLVGVITGRRIVRGPGLVATDTLVGTIGRQYSTFSPASGRPPPDVPGAPLR